MRITRFAAAVLPAVVLGITAAAAAPAGAALPSADRALLAAPRVTTATVGADLLGPDSTVVVVSRGNFDKRNAAGLARSLEIVTADGHRHPVYSVAMSETPLGWRPGDFQVADWRPELHTALLLVSLGADGDRAVSYDVTTGASREVELPERAMSVALDPGGSGVLMTTYPTAKRDGRVATVSWEGATTWLPGRVAGRAITSIDGTTLVTAGGHQRWWVIDLAARRATAIGTRGDCTPKRWYDASSVIATCFRPRSSQLRRIGLDGTSSALGIRHRSGPVMTDEDLRTVQGRSWYESYGGCGGAFLTRQTSAGEARIVRVPGLDGALSLVGTRGDSLVLTHQESCDTARPPAVMTLFDPVTGVETVVTRLRKDEAWSDVLAATEVRAWSG